MEGVTLGGQILHYRIKRGVSEDVAGNVHHIKEGITKRNNPHSSNTKVPAENLLPAYPHKLCRAYCRLWVTRRLEPARRGIGAFTTGSAGGASQSSRSRKSIDRNHIPTKLELVLALSRLGMSACDKAATAFLNSAVRNSWEFGSERWLRRWRKRIGGCCLACGCASFCGYRCLRCFFFPTRAS